MGLRTEVEDCRDVYRCTTEEMEEVRSTERVRSGLGLVTHVRKTGSQVTVPTIRRRPNYCLSSEG